MSEADLMRLLQMRASELGARLFRQQVGMAWAGQLERGPGTFRLLRGDVVIRNARPFHAGIEGMSDLGGWMPIEITPDMVGSTVAVYTQAEIKLRGRPTDRQRAWIDAVKKAGGLAGVARNEEDLIGILSGK